MTVVYGILAILLLGVLVLVHEAGHFLAARWTGVPVHEFAVGFGKRILSTKRGGVIYALRLIPFGGFVSFADPEDEHGVEKYYATSPWKRLVVSVAGSLTNLLVAFVILVIYLMAGGMHESKLVPIVDSVSENTPAQTAGLQANDRVLSINGVQLNDEYEIMSQQITGSNGAPLSFVVQRGEQQLTLTVVPKYIESLGRYQIGITVRTVAGESIHYNFISAVGESGGIMVNAVKQLLGSLLSIVRHGEQGDNRLTSPIGIVRDVAAAAQQSGLEVFVSIAIFLSVNLGVFNLLPLPALDGSKVLFLLYEMIRRKPIPPEKENIVSLVGFGLFILLFVFLAGRDILRLFGVNV